MLSYPSYLPISLSRFFLLLFVVFSCGGAPPFCMTDNFNYFCFVFWLLWVFVAASRLVVVESWGQSSCGALAFHHSGFSCCRTQAVGVQVSVAAACGLPSAVAVVVAHRFSQLPGGIWNPLRPGSKPVPRALAGRFFTYYWTTREVLREWKVLTEC